MWSSYCVTVRMLLIVTMKLMKATMKPLSSFAHIRVLGVSEEYALFDFVLFDQCAFSSIALCLLRPCKLQNLLERLCYRFSSIGFVLTGSTQSPTVESVTVFAAVFVVRIRGAYLPDLPPDLCPNMPSSPASWTLGARIPLVGESLTVRLAARVASKSQTAVLTRFRMIIYAFQPLWLYLNLKFLSGERGKLNTV